MGGLFSSVPPMPVPELDNTITLVYIEGNIGSGKTSLLDALDVNGEIVVRETPDQWRFLSLYYETGKYAFELQTEIALSMKTALEAGLALAQAHKKTRIFVERSIQTAILFARCQFKDRFDSDSIAQHQYDVLCDLFLTLYPAKYHSCTIFLKKLPALCLQHIRQRNRPGEAKHLTLAYLETLDSVFTAFFRTQPHIIIRETTTISDIAAQVQTILGEHEHATE